MGYIEMEDYFYCEINMKCPKSIHLILLTYYYTLKLFKSKGTKSLKNYYQYQFQKLNLILHYFKQYLYIYGAFSFGDIVVLEIHPISSDLRGNGQSPQSRYGSGP